MNWEFEDNGRCFVCGANNPDGLRLGFRIDRERGEAKAEVEFPERFQGWERTVHGGLLATVLDEAMIYAAGARGFRCVTGEITIRYVKPFRTGAPGTVKGRFLGDKGRIVMAESEVADVKGVIAARATGKLFKLA
jgi:uncharacterized protein (TIGR00369 family)